MKKFFRALWRMLRSNLVLKIVAVLFAVVLWSYVLGETNPVRTHDIPNVPVTWENKASLKDNGLAISGNLKDILDTVNIKVKVSQNQNKLINNQNISASIDLSKVSGEGKQILQVNKKTDYGNVVEVSPSQIEVNVDKYMEKDVPVKVETTGSVPAGYYADPPVVSPDRVRIAGASGDVSKVVSALYTVDLSGLTESFNRSYEVTLLDASGNAVDPKLFEEAPSVVINQAVQPVKTVKIDVEKSVTGQDILAPGYEITGITCNPDTVRIVGSKEQLDTISSIAVIPAVSVAGASVDILAPMVFNPPEGVRVLDAENGTITISIREITKTQKYENVPVKIRNIPAGMTAEVSPASIGVTVTAGTGKMSKLLRASVVPYVDVDGRGPGTYYLPVSFVLPDGFVEENFKSGTASVTVILRTK